MDLIEDGCQVARISSRRALAAAPIIVRMQKL